MDTKDPGSERLERLKALIDDDKAPEMATPVTHGPPRMRAEVFVVLGMAGALLVLVAGTFQVGGAFEVLWNPHGFLIVVGGTIAATLIAFRPAQLRMLVRLRRILFPQDPSPEDDIAEMMGVIKVHTRHGIRAAEQDLDRLPQGFLRLGLQLALDAVPLDDLVHALNWRLQKLQERDFADARLFRTMALFAPAFGMFGTVLGLIGILQELGARDLEFIGSQMAVALVTTFYGLCFGYLVFRPLAIRVEQNSERRIAHLTVLMQGVLLFRLGRPPATIEDSVMTLLDSYQTTQGQTTQGQTTQGQTTQAHPNG